METFRILIGPDEGHQTALQLSIRAALLLIFGILCVRAAGRRTFAQYSPLDIIVALVVGSNISRVMVGNAAFFPALAATLVLVLLHRLVAMLALRWRFLGWLVKGQSIVLVRDGVVDTKRLNRHELSESDLLEALRLEQVDSPRDVKLATLEGSGKISVVRKS